MDIKNRLKEIRMKEYAEDPKEFAERLGVNLKTYYTWESGHAAPSLKECIRISDLLKKDVKEIWTLK